VFEFKFIDTVENLKNKENTESGISSEKSVSSTSTKPSGRTSIRGRGLGKKPESPQENSKPKKSAVPEKPKPIPEQSHFDLPKKYRTRISSNRLEIEQISKIKTQTRNRRHFRSQLPETKSSHKEYPEKYLKQHPIPNFAQRTEISIEKFKTGDEGN
jgi:hypothetical protein